VGLISSQNEIPECQPPEAVNKEIWTELLLNGSAKSQPRLPVLRLLGACILPRSGHHTLRHLLEQAQGWLADHGRLKQGVSPSPGPAKVAMPWAGTGKLPCICDYSGITPEIAIPPRTQIDHEENPC
jgi:hypothetical protein